MLPGKSSSTAPTSDQDMQPMHSSQQQNRNSPEHLRSTCDTKQQTPKNGETNIRTQGITSEPQQQYNQPNLIPYEQQVRIMKSKVQFPQTALRFQPSFLSSTIPAQQFPIQ